MDKKCTCESYLWPDCRYDNQHCPTHYRECDCPANYPSQGLWCRFVHCPRKERHATRWRLLVPDGLTEGVVKGLVEAAGGTLQDRPPARSYDNKTIYYFEGSWTVAQTLLSLGVDFEAFPDRP
jgi:hypothetical protein